jgi:hypothetical protein
MIQIAVYNDEEGILFEMKTACHSGNLPSYVLTAFIYKLPLSDPPVISIGP